MQETELSEGCHDSGVMSQYDKVNHNCPLIM